MDYNGAPHSSGRDTYLTIVLCIFVGIPVFVFLNILTGGLFLWLLFAAAGIGVFGVFHYLLWGRAFSQETAGEREEEQLRAEFEDGERPYGESDEYRRW
jgi:hypothetical protein